jgi:uncharacterized protein (DUF1778 family)
MRTRRWHATRRIEAGKLGCISLHVRSEEQALLLRAAALENIGLTDFVMRHALQEAKAIVAEAGRVQLSARDSLRVLELLECPPTPNAKLRAAGSL